MQTLRQKKILKTYEIEKLMKNHEYKNKNKEQYNTKLQILLAELTTIENLIEKRRLQHDISNRICNNLDNILN